MGVPPNHPFLGYPIYGNPQIISSLNLHSSAIRFLKWDGSVDFVSFPGEVDSLLECFIIHNEKIVESSFSSLINIHH